MVLTGILLRAGGGGPKMPADAEAPPGQALGYLAILGSAFGYACLGASFARQTAAYSCLRTRQSLQAVSGIVILGCPILEEECRCCAGVVYDYMMRVEAQPPSHSEVMNLASRIGIFNRRPVDGFPKRSIFAKLKS